MLQIEKNVPLPPSRGCTPTKAFYPWKQMEVGDSFFVTGRKQQHLSAQASVVGKKLGVKFVTRKEGDGVRVWRMA